MVDWRLQNPNAFDAIGVVVREQRRGYVSTFRLIEVTICVNTVRLNAVNKQLLAMFFTIFHWNENT